MPDNAINKCYNAINICHNAKRVFSKRTRWVEADYARSKFHFKMADELRCPIQHYFHQAYEYQLILDFLSPHYHKLIYIKAKTARLPAQETAACGRRTRTTRAVASVRQGGQMPPPPPKFWTGSTIFLCFLKGTMFFVFIVIQNEKVCFFSEKQWLVQHTTAGFTWGFCPRRGLRDVSLLSVLKCCMGSKCRSKSVPCKAPIRDIWHRGSAVISIVVHSSVYERSSPGGTS